MEIIGILLLVGIVALLRSKLRRDGGPDIGWSTNGSAALVTAVPAADLERGSERAVARELGRVESRHLAGSFSLAVGIAFSLLIVVVFGIVWAADAEEAWESGLLNTPIFVYPLVGMIIIGVHAAVTRERRDGTAELFESCPAPPRARTAGYLRTAWVPVVVVIASVGLFALAVIWKDSAFGPVPLRSLGDVLAAMALAVGGTFLGVALGRWTPWWPAPIAAIVAIGVVSAEISGIGEPGHWSQLRQLSTFPRYPDYDVVFAIRPVWWHLAWLLALCAAVAVIALLHDRRDRVMAIAGGATLAALVVTGFATSRPLDASEAERVASMVANPERHQECVELTGGSICTFDGYAELSQMFDGEIDAVLAGLPTSAPDGLVARQVYDDRLEELDPEVRDRLPIALPESDADVQLGFGSHDDVFVAARIATGLWAVGLPSRGGLKDPWESVAGESPGVVALWLAAAGLSPEDAIELATADTIEHSDGSVDPYASSMAWPEPCEAGGSPVIWSPQDLQAARALLELPRAQVGDVLDAEWDRWTDRATSTDELMARFDLPAVGSSNAVLAGVWECEY